MRLVVRRGLTTEEFRNFYHPPSNPRVESERGMSIDQIHR